MELTISKQTPNQHEDNNILRMLDRGIDDMEAGRELPLEEAFRKITELRDDNSGSIKFKQWSVIDHCLVSQIIQDMCFWKRTRQIS